MNFNDLAKTFWHDGYLVLPDFFAPKLMDKLQQIILQNYGEAPDFSHNQEFLEKSATEVVPWFPQREGVTQFDEVDRNAQLMKLSQAILGDGWKSLYCMAMYSKPGSKGQAWHQDCPPDDAKQFNLNRLVYTMDINEETGGQVVIMPGSHKRGLLSVGQVDEDFSEQVVLTPNKGTLVILHGHCWHRVLPISRSYRVSTNYRAMPKDTPEAITDICVYRNMRYQFSTNQVLEDRLLSQ